MPTDSLPPMTPDELAVALKVPQYVSYVYIGGEEDRGWEVARAAPAFIALVVVFRASDEAQVSRWLGEKKGVAGIVFGWGDEVYRTFDQAETEDFVRVVSAVADAMKETMP